MNILLWIIQAALALLALAGGAYKLFAFDQVAGEPWFSALPRSGWSALGVFEILCGVLLIVPAALKWMPALTPLAAAVLALGEPGPCRTVRAIFARTDRCQPVGLERRDGIDGRRRGLWAAPAQPAGERQRAVAFTVPSPPVRQPESMARRRPLAP
jgi:hypothetical protein